MGKKHSVYDRSHLLDYCNLKPKEHNLIRNVWMEVDNNPEFHGTAFFTGLCQTYPQYTKYYTLDPRSTSNFNIRLTAKFTIIMEVLGYLLLDFHNKPKKLNWLIGYIAMLHKDMQLEKQDIENFVAQLIQYLAQTFPTEMNVTCIEIVTKYLNSIANEVIRKMEEFREYEAIHDITTSLEKLKS